MTHHTNSADPATAVSPGERAAAAGTLGGAIAAIPLVGRSLVAGCLSCVGVGAAAGLGATSALPPLWWLAGVAITGAGTLLAGRRSARRCQRRPQPVRILAVLLVVAIAAWIATRFVVLPAIDATTGGAAPPADGPTPTLP